MTSAGQAILNELKRISESEHAGLGDGAEAKATFGLEPWNDEDMQGFIEAGYEFASGGDGQEQFQKRMAVAVAWMHLGYRAAQNEVKQ